MFGRTKILERKERRKKEKGSKMQNKKENKDLIDKLFTSIEQRVKDREKSNKLSKSTRIRQNGRILDVFLLYLSDNTASISFVDVGTKVEVSTVDVREPDLRLNLTYKEACDIYDEILKRSEVEIENPFKTEAEKKRRGQKPMSAYDCECGGRFERIPILTEEEGNELEDYAVNHPFKGDWNKIEYIGHPEKPEYPDND